MSDLISRKMVIEKLESLMKDMENEIEDAKKHPENYTKNFIRGMGAQVAGVAHAAHEIIDMPLAEPIQPQGDLISRQATIRWVKTECNPYGKPTLDFESGKKVIEHLRQMPSAEPVHGEWVNEWKDIDGGRMYGSCCSACHTIGHSGYNFCPNCGAKMIAK